MNTQTQNPTANFDFIVNQPGQEQPKKPKRLALLIVMAVVAVVLVGGAFAAKILGGVSSGAKNLTSQQQAANQIVSNYFSNIYRGETAKSFALLTAASQKNTTEKDFVLFNAGTINVSYDLSKCALSGSPEVNSPFSRVVYVCPTKNGKYETSFRFNLLTAEGFKVDGYDPETKAL